jgi:hypothetical protein
MNWYGSAKKIKLLDNLVSQTASVIFNSALAVHFGPHGGPCSGFCFAFGQPFAELGDIVSVLPAVLFPEIRMGGSVPRDKWRCHDSNKVFIDIKRFCNMPNQKRRQQRQQPRKMRMPQYRRQPMRYPSAQRTINTAINAGVTLGTVAIGASVLTGVIGALTK